MNYYDFPYLVYRNAPQSVVVSNGYIEVIVRDGRKLALPVSMFSWLERATPEQQAQVELSDTDILWTELEDGISMATFLGWYTPLDDLLSPEQFAIKHSIDKRSVYRILRGEMDSDNSERRIPGAFYRSEGNRRQWYIPKASAEAFVPDKRGAKPKVKES